METRGVYVLRSMIWMLALYAAPALTATLDCVVEKKVGPKHVYSASELSREQARVVVEDDASGAVLSRCSFAASAGRVTCDRYAVDRVEESKRVGDGGKIELFKKYYLFRSHFDVQVFADKSFIENNGRGLIAFGTCSEAPPPPREQKARTWQAGVGVDGCRLGDALSACEASLGPAVRDVEGYASFAVGVQVALKDIDNTVQSVFVMYRSTTLSPFAGSDAAGVGRDATPEKVISVYGQPAKVSESIVSQYGEFPGARDRSLMYPGLVFTFYDGALAHVAISSARKK